jgi:hypothetical protein
MSREENLKPFNTMTVEEQRKIAKKGAEASVRSRKKNKELKERIALALEYLTQKKSEIAETEEEASIIQSVGYDTFVVLKEIEKGNLTAIDRFWDRQYGRPLQQTEDLTENKLEKIKIEIVSPNGAENKSNRFDDKEPKQPNENND